MHWLLPLVWVAMSTDKPKQPPAEAEAPCTHWQGTVSGNDPSVRVTVILCPVGDDRIAGQLVWESKRSGTNTRTLEGKLAGKTFTLRDINLDGHPNPGWRFCKIDRYSLTLEGNARLEGTYQSSECSDNARVKLERVR